MKRILLVIIINDNNFGVWIKNHFVEILSERGECHLFGAGKRACVKDGAYFCYCARVLRITQALV